MASSFTTPWPGTPFPPSSISLGPAPPAPPPPAATPPPTPASLASTNTSSLLPSPPLLSPPRPRLKRSHASTTSIASSSQLDPIDELGATEDALASMQMSRSRESSFQGMTTDENGSLLWGGGAEGARERKRKRIATGPDHEAFDRLSLQQQQQQLSPTGQQPQLFPLPNPPPLWQTNPSAMTSTSQPPFATPLSAFPPPKTPPLQQGETHLSVTNPSAPSLLPTPSPPPPPLPLDSSSFGLGLDLNHPIAPPPSPVRAFAQPPPPLPMEDAPMSSSYDISPHRIYVASLDDSPPPSPTTLTSSAPLLNFPASLLAPPSPLPPELLGPAASGAGQLILYRPLTFGSSKEEEEERRDELEEFRRQQQTVEADDHARIGEGEDEDEDVGMEVDG